MDKIFDKLPMMFILISGLAMVWLIFGFVFSAENEPSSDNEKTSVPMTDSSSFGTVKTDETTGCEYIIFRNIVIPRIDETGEKVRGCKDSD